MAQAKIKKLQSGGTGPIIGGVYNVDNIPNGASGAVRFPRYGSHVGDEWLRLNTEATGPQGTISVTSADTTTTATGAGQTVSGASGAPNDTVASEASVSTPTSTSSSISSNNSGKYGRVNINGVLYQLTPTAYKQILSRISNLDADEDFVGDIQSFLDYAKNPDNVLYFNTARNTGHVMNRNGDIVYDTHLSPRSKFSAWWGSLFNSKMNRYNRSLASVFGALDPEWFKVEETANPEQSKTAASEKKKYTLEQLAINGNWDTDDYTNYSPLYPTLNRIDLINDYYNNPQWSSLNEFADDETTAAIVRNIDDLKKYNPNIVAELNTLKETLLKEPWNLTDPQKNLLKSIGSDFGYYGKDSEGNDVYPTREQILEYRKNKDKKKSASGSGSGNGGGSNETSSRRSTQPKPVITDYNGQQSQQTGENSQSTNSSSQQTDNNTQSTNGSDNDSQQLQRGWRHVYSSGDDALFEYSDGVYWLYKNGQLYQYYVDENGKIVNKDNPSQELPGECRRWKDRDGKEFAPVQHKNGGKIEKMEDGRKVVSKSDGFSTARAINAGLGLASAGVGFVPVIGDAAALIGNGVTDLVDLGIDLLDPKVSTKQAFANLGANLALSAVALIPGADAAKGAKKAAQLAEATDTAKKAGKAAKAAKAAKATVKTNTVIQTIGDAAESAQRAVRLNDLKEVKAAVKAVDEATTKYAGALGKRTAASLSESKDIITQALGSGRSASKVDWNEIYNQSATILNTLRKANRSGAWRQVGNIASGAARAGVVGYGGIQGVEHLLDFSQAVNEVGLNNLDKLDADDYRNLMYGLMPVVGVGRRAAYNTSLRRAGATPTTNKYSGRHTEVSDRIDSARDIYINSNKNLTKWQPEQEFIDLIPGYNSYSRRPIRTRRALTNLAKTPQWFVPASSSRSWISGGHKDASFYGLGTGVTRNPEDERAIRVVPIEKQGGKIEKFQYGGSNLHSNLQEWLDYMRKIQNARNLQYEWDNGLSQKYAYFKKDDGSYDLDALNANRAGYKNVNFDIFKGDDYGGYKTKKASEVTDDDYSKIFTNYDANNRKSFEELFNKIMGVGDETNPSKLGLGLTNEDITYANNSLKTLKDFNGQLDTDYNDELNLFNDLQYRGYDDNFVRHFQRSIKGIDPQAENVNELYAEKWKDALDWARKKYNHQGDYGSNRLGEIVGKLFDKDYNKQNLLQASFFNNRARQIGNRYLREMNSFAPGFGPHQEAYNFDASPYSFAKNDLLGQYNSAIDNTQMSDGKSLLAYQQSVFGKTQDSLNKFNQDFAKSVNDVKDKNKQIEFANQERDYKAAEAKKQHFGNIATKRHELEQTYNYKYSDFLNKYLSGKASVQQQKERNRDYILSEEARQLGIKARTPNGLTPEEKIRLKDLYKYLGVDSNLV